jgi:hypothetical protein
MAGPDGSHSISAVNRDTERRQYTIYEIRKHSERVLLGCAGGVRRNAHEGTDRGTNAGFQSLGGGLGLRSARGACFPVHCLVAAGMAIQIAFGSMKTVRRIFLLLVLAAVSPALAAAQTDAQYDKAAHRLDVISKRIETWLAAKQKVDCEVPEACDYVGKFRAAQKAWSDWVDAEFAYENYGYGGAGTVVSNALTAYRIAPMDARARKLEQDYQRMQKGNW